VKRAGVETLLLDHPPRRVRYRYYLSRCHCVGGDLSGSGATCIQHFHTEDVLRFLGRKAHSINSGEVKSVLARRVEGVRVKHWVHENSLKMYDKQGSVLRIETTINNPKRFRVRRRLTSHGPFKWLSLRKGIADIRRRVQLSRAANERYLEALAVVGVEPTRSHKLLDEVSVAVTRGRRRFRALRLVSPEDSRLFQALLDGKFLIQGIRNKELRQLLFPAALDPLQQRRLAGRITRWLSLLKSHDLIYRVPKTNYYRLTKLGQEVMTTAAKFRDSNIALLAASNFVRKTRS
jgi:hypothetical protein